MLKVVILGELNDKQKINYLSLFYHYLHAISDEIVIVA
nr:hypothetical protein [Mucilaginibacter sp. X4EP1]